MYLKAVPLDGFPLQISWRHISKSIWFWWSLLYKFREDKFFQVYLVLVKPQKSNLSHCQGFKAQCLCLRLWIRGLHRLENRKKTNDKSPTDQLVNRLNPKKHNASMDHYALIGSNKRATKLDYKWCLYLTSLHWQIYFPPNLQLFALWKEKPLKK